MTSSMPLIETMAMPSRPRRLIFNPPRFGLCVHAGDRRPAVQFGVHKLWRVVLMAGIAIGSIPTGTKVNDLRWKSMISDLAAVAHRSYGVSFRWRAPLRPAVADVVAPGGELSTDYAGDH